MKICIPTINEYETLNNSDHSREHGTCHLMENLKDKGIDFIACKGLGRKALETFDNCRIKIFRIDRTTVKDIVEDFSNSKGEEINPENACRNHRCH